MIISKHFRFSIIAIYCFLVVFLRPSIIGFVYQKIIAGFICILALALCLNYKGKVEVDKQSRHSYLLIVICNIYFLLQGIVLSDAVGTVVNAVGFALFFSSLNLLFINRSNLKTFFSCFINIHVFSCIFPLITFVISSIFGFNFYKIPILFNLSDFLGFTGVEGNEHLVIFPFTPIWGISGIMGISFPRWIGYYTEPGLNAFYLGICLFFCYFYNVERWKIILLYAGLILTFSALGYIVAIIMFVYYLFAVKKMRISAYSIMIIFLLIAMAAYPIYTVLIEKFTTVSGITRVYSLFASFERLLQKPLWGWGYYSMSNAGNELVVDGFLIYDQTIGLVGVAFQLGLVGLLLYCTIWIHFIKKMIPTGFWGLIIPIILTILFVQPNFNDPFIWLLLTVNFKLQQANS